MPDKQAKSKQRVSDHGEVFTNDKEVNDMCNLVSQECDRADSRFLEPACGNGNFLAEIIKRKLTTVKRLHKSNPYDFERYSVLAISSIYGVDILYDNVLECRKRIFDIWNKEYKSVCKKECSEDTREAVIYILEKNILCGNALTLMQVDENCEDTNEPIIFPEWSLIGSKFKRRDFRLDVLLKANGDTNTSKQSSLFEEDLYQYLTTNPVTGEYMPLPIQEYPPTLFKKLREIGY